VASRDTCDRLGWPTNGQVGRCPAPVQPDELLAVLMRTLWGYHGLGCDLARIAAALGKHRSTVRYRLYRVRELTGLEPEDPRSVEALLEIAGLHA
jgi:sugar diacid utilization regulator